MKFFFDCEFKSSTDNLYWFPLFVEATDADEAERRANSVEVALAEHYQNVRRAKPSPYIDEFTSEFIDNYVKNRSQGKVTSINVRLWQLTNIPSVPGWNLSEHLKLIENNASAFVDTEIATVSAARFPVRLVHKNPMMNYDEFLLINVVAP